MEERTQYLLNPTANHATMDAGPPDIIVVSRSELESEHNHLLARLHQVRRLLNYPVLMTGKQMRKRHE